MFRMSLTGPAWELFYELEFRAEEARHSSVPVRPSGLRPVRHCGVSRAHLGPEGNPEVKTSHWHRWPSVQAAAGGR